MTARSGWKTARASGGATTSCPDDLLVASWRGALAREEALALDGHLEACADCRLSRAVGRAVGPLPPVDAADEALAARLVARALAPRAVVSGAAAGVVRPREAARGREVGRARVRLPRWAAVAAALALSAGAASAAVWTARRASSARRRAETPELLEPSRGGRPARAAAPALAAPPPAALAPTPGRDEGPPRAAAPTPLSARASAVVAPRAATRSRSPEQPGADASSLFREANDARRARRLDDARRAYQTLQARFPASAEATLSHLSLGNLELGRAAFAAALVEFDAYVASGAPELGEEALVGKAKALRGLGRAADERDTWRALEARYPSSDYRWRAHQRLEELGAAGDPP